LQGLLGGLAEPQIKFFSSVRTLCFHTLNLAARPTKSRQFIRPSQRHTIPPSYGKNLTLKIMSD
jgi:hypothetical protein